VKTVAEISGGTTARYDIKFFQNLRSSLHGIHARSIAGGDIGLVLGELTQPGW
jgi:hypothetical protein